MNRSIGKTAEKSVNIHLTNPNLVGWRVKGQSESWVLTDRIVSGESLVIQCTSHAVMTWTSYLPVSISIMDILLKCYDSILQLPSCFSTDIIEQNLKILLT